MLPQLFPPPRLARLVTSIGSSAVLALGLCGCQTSGPSDITGALGDKTETSQAADPRRDLDTYRDALRANSKDLPKAEETLRRANGHAATGQRIRTNLAFVVGLQGRTSEAEGLVKADLTPEEAAASVAALKQLLSRNANARADADKIPVGAT